MYLVEQLLVYILNLTNQIFLGDNAEILAAFLSKLYWPWFALILSLIILILSVNVIII